MKKNKITFLILECIFLILTLFFAWKIFELIKDDAKGKIIMMAKAIALSFAAVFQLLVFAVASCTVCFMNLPFNLSNACIP